MAWEISHTAEAWDNVRHNLRGWTVAKLVDALAEDRFVDVYEHGGYDNAKRAAEALRKRVSNADADALVDAVIEVIERNGLCSNGGGEFYVDAEGGFTVDVDVIPCDDMTCELCNADEDGSNAEANDGYGE